MDPDTNPAITTAVNACKLYVTSLPRHIESPLLTSALAHVSIAHSHLLLAAQFEKMFCEAPDQPGDTNDK